MKIEFTVAEAAASTFAESLHSPFHFRSFFRGIRQSKPLLISRLARSAGSADDLLKRVVPEQIGSSIA